MGELTIVSACFYINDIPAWRLAESCKKLGLNLSLYGLHETWDNNVNIKVVKLLEHLQTIKTKYILFTDAADSWMLRPEQDILNEFLKQKTKILISAEKNLYPFIEGIYPPSPTSMRYICAGGFIGETESIKSAMVLLQKYGSTGSDQLLWQQLFLSGQMDIKIDYEAKIFLSMGSVELDEIEISPIVFKETNSQSCVIHFNGGKGGSKNEQNMIQVWNENLQ